MAKYTVDFSCGHTAKIELVGKYVDRYNRIEWLEKCGKCPDCYKASKPAKPIEVSVHSLYEVKNKETFTAIIALTGNTYPVKDEIKKMGFKFDSYVGWYRETSELSTDEEIVTAALALTKEISHLGNVIFDPMERRDTLPPRGRKGTIDFDEKVLKEIYQEMLENETI